MLKSEMDAYRENIDKGLEQMRACIRPTQDRGGQARAASVS